MKPRILVVDDNEKIRVLISDSMNLEGYEVDTAMNGAEALKKVASFQPDLILLDIMMPVMDGFEVCRRLKSSEDTRYIPVVMLTARGEMEDKLMGLEVGAEDYIVKPFSRVEVSARVKSLLRMRTLQAKLAESEKVAALGDLVDGIAHEIRNPLTTIGGMARRLHEHEADEERRRYTDVIMKSVERMEKMMQRIDEYKEVLSGHYSQGDVNEVIAKAVEEVKPFIGAKAIVINTVLMPDTQHLNMDSTNLKISIFNILQNSIEAIEDKGEIRVETLPEADSVLVIRITDNGPGMDAAFVKKLFHPFHTSKMTGAGMGLTISHRIINDHHGSIEVESEKDKGTTFTIRFHLAQGLSVPG